MDKKKKHILVISQYFHPEGFRINDICTEWVNRGYKVTVVTGIPNYPQGKYYPGYGLFKKRKETWNGMDIIRIPLVPRGKTPIGLALNYLSFVVSGYIWNLVTNIKADVVFIYEVSPMTQALVGVWYALKRKLKCYIYVTDLWPENVEIVAGIKNKQVIGAIGKMVDYIYARCHKIFTSSESFVSAIQARGVDREKIEFWPQYAEDFYLPVEKTKAIFPEIQNDGRFHICFAGNIGVAQGLDILPETAKLLKDRQIKVCFDIVGDGRYKEALIKKVEDAQVKDMFCFIEKQPAERIPEIMSCCDAALICLSKSKVFAMTIPAKFQSSIACGKPIIASADGEIQKVVNEAKAGVSCNAGDHVMLAEKIAEMVALTKEELETMGLNALMYSKEHYSKNKLLDRMDDYFR